MSVKRLLDAYASELHRMTGRDLVEAIRASEGRVICAEIVAGAPPLVDGVSNAELAAAMGADMLLLNLYDVQHPSVAGFPDSPGAASPGDAGGLLARVKAWTGRLLGVNLEPLEPKMAAALGAAGRLATPENAQQAVDQGADFVVITGNPASGVTPAAIARAVATIRAAVRTNAVIFAGRMHASGTGQAAVQEEDVRAYLGAGADGVLIPLPGTAPAVSIAEADRLTRLVHASGGVVMGTIGTSQEGASVAVIEHLALMGKMAGVDIHHIGDAGLRGVAVPENIMVLSMAVRGRRHTWRRMAASPFR